LGVVVHAYNPRTLETKEGGEQVRDQPGLRNETLLKEKGGNGRIKRRERKRMGEKGREGKGGREGKKIMKQICAP
jgi:hypothetical protein